MKEKTRIDWFGVGKDHWEGKQDIITGYCRKVKWQSLPCEMSMMGGEAIKTLISEHRLPKVDAVAESNDLAPFGLLGIWTHFKNADVRFFAVDEGTHISSLCAFVDERGIK